MREYLFEDHRKTVFMYLNIGMFRSHNVAAVNSFTRRIVTPFLFRWSVEQIHRWSIKTVGLRKVSHT